MPTTDPKIAELHEMYCKLTGFDLPLRMGRDRAWFDFDKAGFTKDDLLLVIAWIRRQIGIARSGYTIGSLRFSNILQLDYFEERLQLARMEERSKQRKPATEMREVKAGGISRQVEVPTKSAEPVLAGSILRDWLEKQKHLPTS